MMKIAVCIPTFKRPDLLKLLIGDIARQSQRPDTLVVVDGDPSSGQVKNALEGFSALASTEIRYVASTHPNLAFQRYLGHLVAKDHDVLVYLDDDLRINDRSTLAKFVAPLAKRNNYVAGTSEIRFPSAPGDVPEAVKDRIDDSRRARLSATRWLGSSAYTRPGGMTPAGNRVLPPPSGSDISEVEWLRGGAMAFRAEILSEEFFSDDLFALTKIGCGLGEDSYLGRRALSFGKLYLANNVVIDHPNADSPKAYPTAAYRLGLATAYSRRFINDTYRGVLPPTIVDRVLLLRSLLGGGVLAFARAALSPSVRRWSYAGGYMNGVVRAMFVKPTSSRLAPDTNWRLDALRCVRAMERM